MIYALEDNYMDLSKLQYVSKIMSKLDDNVYWYYFRYSIADFTWDSIGYRDKTTTIETRNKLIEVWKQYKDK